MRVACIGAVDFNSDHFKTQQFDHVIAVDAGWASCGKHGIHADTALGDFDSLGFVPVASQVVQFPSVKDESDMELAIDHALSLGASEVALYGAFADRIDHTLANIQIMGACARRGAAVWGVGSTFALAALAAGEGVPETTPHTLSFAAFDPAVLSGPYAPHLSLFVLDGQACGVSIAGLQYEVTDFTLPGGTSRGLSNQFMGAQASIRVTQGCLVAIFPLDALEYVTFQHMQ